MNDEQLKQALKALQQEGGFSVVEEGASSDVPSVQEAAMMEPPRGDYSKKPDQYAKIRDMVKNLPSTLSPSENPAQDAPTRVSTVYADGSDQEKMSPYQQAADSISKKFINDPNFNSMENFEKLRKRYGK